MHFYENKRSSLSGVMLAHAISAISPYFTVHYACIGLPERNRGIFYAENQTKRPEPSPVPGGFRLVRAASDIFTHIDDQQHPTNDVLLCCFNAIFVRMIVRSLCSIFM